MTPQDLANIQTVAASIENVAAQLVTDMQGIQSASYKSMKDRPAYWAAQVVDITLQYGINELSKRAMQLNQYLPLDTPSPETMEDMARQSDTMFIEAAPVKRTRSHHRKVEGQ